MIVSDGESLLETGAAKGFAYDPEFRQRLRGCLGRDADAPGVADVERELFRLHQFRKLRYEVAGSLVELTLPCSSAAAFVEEMAA